MRELETVKRLGDEELVRQLKRWVREDRELTATILVHLGEVEERGLFRDEGFSSMFNYAVRGLAMSEAQATLRIRAARVARKFPEALEMVVRGELHLSALCILAPVLSQDCLHLLRLARHKSKVEVYELVAKYFPKPDVPAEIRRLAVGAHARFESPGEASSSTVPVATSLLAALENNTAAIQSNGEADDRQAPSACSHALGTAETTYVQTPGLSDPTAIDTRALEQTYVGAWVNTLNIQSPLSEDRYKVQFTASKRFINKLEKAKTLSRHQIPTGDLEAIFERGLDLFITDREKTMFGLTERPRARRRPSAVRENVQPDDESTSTPAKRSASRYVPREVRRQVYLRDAGRCCFVARSGIRCEAREHLEFHHIVPFARGGEMTTENIQLRCRAHNALEAERDFGRKKVKQQIESRQASRALQRKQQSAAINEQQSSQLTDDQTTVRRPSELHEEKVEQLTQRRVNTQESEAAQVAEWRAQRQTNEVDQVAQQRAQRQTNEVDQVAQQRAQRQTNEVDQVAQQRAERPKNEVDQVAQQRAQRQTNEVDQVARQRAERPKNEVEQVAQPRAERQRNEIDHGTVSHRVRRRMNDGTDETERRQLTPRATITAHR